MSAYVDIPTLRVMFADSQMGFASFLIYFTIEVPESTARRIWYIRKAPLLLASAFGFVLGGFVSEIVQSFLPVRLRPRVSAHLSFRVAHVSGKSFNGATSWPTSSAPRYSSTSHTSSTFAHANGSSSTRYTSPWTPTTPTYIVTPKDGSMPSTPVCPSPPMLRALGQTAISARAAMFGKRAARRGQARTKGIGRKSCSSWGMTRMKGGEKSAENRVNWFKHPHCI